MHYLSWLNPRIRANLNGPSLYFTDFYDRGDDFYRSLMPCTAPQEIGGENCPANFVDAKAPTRIKAMNSSIRLILVVCDPVKRLISDYTHFRSVYGMKSMRDHRSFVSHDKAKQYTTSSFPPLEWFLGNNTRLDTRFVPLTMGHYDVYIRNWLEHFPKEQIHIVDAEAFIVEPWEELNGVERFLGVPSVITRENFTFVSSKGFYCLNLDGEVFCMKDTKGRKHPNLKDDVIQKLYGHYSPHNRQFFMLINRLFDWAFRLGEFRS